MSTLEIIEAVKDLQPDDLKRFADWFAEYEEDLWDKQIEADLKSGRLNALIEKANRDFDSSKRRSSSHAS